MRYCHKCSAEMPDDAEFCPVCRTPAFKSSEQQATPVLVDPPSTQQERVLSYRSNKGQGSGAIKYVLIGAAALVVVVGVAVVLLFALKGNGGPESVVSEYYEQLMKGQAEPARELMTEKMLEEANPANSVEPAPDLDYEIIASKAMASTASVTVKCEGESFLFNLIKEDGEWKIDEVYAMTEEGVVVSTSPYAQRRTCQSNQRTIDGAIQSYESLYDNPTYPNSLESMTMPGTKTLKSVSTCPSGDEPYIWVEGDPPYISCPNNADHTI